MLRYFEPAQALLVAFLAFRYNLYGSIKIFHHYEALDQWEQSLAIYLHDDTVHDVLEWLLQLGEASQAGLYHPVGPLVHLGVLKVNTARLILSPKEEALLDVTDRITVASDGRLYGFLDHVGDLVHHELCFLGRVIPHLSHSLWKYDQISSLFWSVSVQPNKCISVSSLLQCTAVNYRNKLNISLRTVGNQLLYN